MIGGINLQRMPFSWTDFVVGTPGRVIDNIMNKRLDLSDIRTFVIDEAHRMIDSNFIENVDYIYTALKENCKTKPQLVMISATLSDYVKDQLSHYCGDNYKLINLVENLENRTPKTVSHYVLRVERKERPGIIPLLFNSLVEDSSKKVIVFANTKDGIREVFERAKIKNSQLLYGNMQQYDRLRVFNDFRKGRINVLFATDVAARGLDIPNLDVVIQLEPPNDIDLYIHRAGRTARAGKSGKVISVWDTLAEHERLGKIENLAGVKFRNLEYNEETGEIEKTDKVHKFSKSRNESKPRTSYWSTEPKNGKSRKGSNPSNSRVVLDI